MRHAGLILIFVTACSTVAEGNGFSFEKFSLADWRLAPPPPPAAFDPAKPLNQDRGAEQVAREQEAAAKKANAKFKLVLHDGTLVFASALENEANRWRVKKVNGELVSLSLDQVSVVQSF